MFFDNLVILLSTFVFLFFYISIVIKTFHIKIIDLRKITTFFVMGLLSVVAVFYAHVLFPDILNWKYTKDLYEVWTQIKIWFFKVGFLEELCKLSMLLLGNYLINNKNFKNNVLYAVVVAGGFALFENITYGMDYGVKVVSYRNMTAVLLHLCCGLVMGNYLTLSNISKNRLNKAKNLVYALGVPTLIHGTYDYAATNNPEYLMGVLGGVLILTILMSKYIIRKRLHHND